MLKSIFSLSFVNLLQALSAFCVIICLARFYDKLEYATYRQLFLPFEMLAPLLGMGLHSSIYFFFPRARSAPKLLGEILIIVLGTCLVFEIVLITGASSLIARYFENPKLNAVLPIIGVFAFVSSANTIFNSYYILCNRIRLLTVLNSIFFALIIFGTLGLALLHVCINAVVVWRVVSYTLLFFAFLWHSGIVFETNIKVPGQRRVSELLKFSLPISASAIIGNFSYHLDKWIVSTTTSPETFAIYVNGAIEIPLIAIITSSVSSVMIAQMSAMIKNKDIENALRVFKNSAIVTSLFLFPIFCYFMLYANEIIVVLFGEEYLESASPFRIYLLLLPIRIIFYGPIFVVLGKSKELLTRSFVELGLNVVLSFLLLEFFGYMGVALGTVLSTYLWTVPFNLYTIRKELRVRLASLIPFVILGRIFLVSFLACAVAFFCSFIFTSLHGIWFILLTSSIFITAYLICLVVFRIVALRDKRVLAILN